MATKNITRKIAALAELRKDPADAIAKAWKAVRTDAQEFIDGQNGIAHESDADLIDQIVCAVIADIRADKKGDAS